MSFQDAVKTLNINKHRISAIILMGPLTARLLVERRGFTRKSAVKKWLWENSKITIKEWRDSIFYKNSLMPRLGTPGHHPTWYADPDLDPDTIVPVFAGPDSIDVIVSGGSFTGGVISKGQELGECYIWEMGQASSVSIDKWR